MRSEKPTAFTEPEPQPTAGTKPGSGVPELYILRASELDDEASTEIELPAELPDGLAALASQLQSDAARLANLYPPSAKPVTAVPGHAGLLTPQRLGAAVAMLLIGISGAWQFLPRRPAAISPAAAIARTVDRAESGEATALSPAVAEAAYPTTYSIAELTSPELEALVDLMQRESRDSSAIQRVSF